MPTKGKRKRTPTKKPKKSRKSAIPKTKGEVRFDLYSVLQQDAGEIVAARAIGKVAHATKDIDTSGSEVEEAVRSVLKRKLPGSVGVEHGHLVDASLACSPQIDVAVVAPTDLIRLMRAKDGTSYIPCESVYAIGEVKTAFIKKYVGEFSSTLTRVGTLRRGRNPLQPSSRQNYKFGNPLYSFMLFVESKDDPLPALKEVIGDLTSSAQPLPDAICILDRGLVLNCTFRDVASGGERLGNINVMPDFATDGNRAWCLMPFGAEEHREGANLGVLVALLIEHINSSLLLQPDIFQYMHALFKAQNYQRLDR